MGGPIHGIVTKCTHKTPPVDGMGQGGWIPVIGSRGGVYGGGGELTISANLDFKLLSIKIVLNMF